MSWRKFLVIPQLIFYGVRAPKSQTEAWERFWSRIGKTGEGGQVLWDAASKVELDEMMARLGPHADLSLPMVDVGCGNGRQSRYFATRAPRVLGIDQSESAVKRAKEESAGIKAVDYRVADMTSDGFGAAVHGEYGDSNVHVRGVLHVLDHAGRLKAVTNLRAMLGARGTLYLSETNIESPLDHLEFQGATATSMPDPLLRCIQAGIRPPAHFGDKEVKTYFPAAEWDTRLSGPGIMHGVPLHEGRTIEDIPSYVAIVRPRA